MPKNLSCRWKLSVFASGELRPWPLSPGNWKQHWRRLPRLGVSTGTLSISRSRNKLCITAVEETLDNIRQWMCRWRCSPTQLLTFIPGTSSWRLSPMTFLIRSIWKFTCDEHLCSEHLNDNSLLSAMQETTGVSPTWEENRVISRAAAWELRHGIVRARAECPLQSVSLADAKSGFSQHMKKALSFNST